MNPILAPVINPLDASIAVRYPPVELLRRIIGSESNCWVQACVTGAGADLVADLVRMPGSSARVAGAAIPYKQSQVIDFMGYSPGRSVSEETAVGLAQIAYLTAQRTAVQHGEFEKGNPPRIVGVGLTGAVATDRERRGEDHIWIAVRSVDGIKVGHFSFAKGVGENTRVWQNELANQIGLNVIADAVGAQQLLSFEPELVQSRVGSLTASGLALDSIQSAELDFARPQLIMPDGAVADPAILTPDKYVVYPGSFRSFHCGHDLAAVNAATVSGKRVVFEISAINADKSPIDGAELSRRALQFRGRYPVLVTPNAPLFRDKSAAYEHGMGFVVGYDTALRLLDSKFYPDCSSADQILAPFVERGNQFFVLGRTDSDGTFKTIRDLPVAGSNRDLFRELTGQLNISASALARI